MAGSREPVDPLDGTWDVRRTSGLLPPLLGVRKEIRGTQGSTILLHRAAGAPFDVVGLELHYRGPFAGFVDVLEPEGDAFRGRATFRGRTFARFRMVAAEGGAMGNVQEHLVKHLDEAHAMELGVRRMLDGLVAGADDPELRTALERHRAETAGHVERMRARLEAHGTSPSTVRQLGGIIGALAKLPLDLVRDEGAARDARDAYATEHMEIAAYELLSRVATRAGDDETVQACREILAQERAMVEAIEASWDRVADLALREEGVPVP